MGGFQAIASGIGETGENLGQGINNALMEALKYRAQAHTEDVDKAHIQLLQAGQEQALNIAKMQNETSRQQLLQNGWNHIGTVKGDDGKYYQQYDNPRMPPGQQTMRMPYEGGVPPDSPEGTMQAYKYFASQQDNKGNPLFNHREIIEKVMGLHNQYRTDPAGIIQGFRKDIEEQFDSGLKAKYFPGFGRVDITTPEGRDKAAQIDADSYWGKGAFLRASMGVGAKPIDMTGWTANEQREYKAFETEVARQEQAASKMAEIGMSNSLQTMQDPAGSMKSAFDGYNNIVGPLREKLQAKQDEINGRHGRGEGDMVPVVAPNGATGRVARADLAKALAHGYKLALAAQPNQ